MNIGDRKDVVVGEYTYHIMPWAPFKAAKNLGTLQKYILPVVGKLADGVAHNPDVLEMDTNTDMGSIMSCLDGTFQEIANRLDENAIDALLKMILDSEYISVDDPATGKPAKLTEPVLNRLFTGNIADMFVLAAEVIKVNYSDFFTIFGSRFGNLGMLINRK